MKNTGIVQTDKQGTILVFNGESYEDWREIDEDWEDESEDGMEWDRLRAKQALDDVKTCQTLGMVMVKDTEAAAKPFTTDEYIKYIENYIADISE